MLMKNFLFLNEYILDENDENRTQHHVRNDKKHRSTQLSFFEFIAKFNSFRMKTRVNFMKLFSQYLFFQKNIEFRFQIFQIILKTVTSIHQMLLDIVKNCVITRNTF